MNKVSSFLKKEKENQSEQMGGNKGGWAQRQQRKAAEEEGQYLTTLATLINTRGTREKLENIQTVKIRNGRDTTTLLPEIRIIRERSTNGRPRENGGIQRKMTMGLELGWKWEVRKHSDREADSMLKSATKMPQTVQCQMD